MVESNAFDWSSILIGRLSALGDIVFALPVLSSLRAAHPTAKIGWLIEDRCADLLRGHPWIDELIIYPRGGLKGWPRHPLQALRRLKTFRRELAARSYDVALELQGNLKCAAQLACIQGARRIGFDRSELRERSSAWFTDVKVDPSATRRHRMDKMLSILAPLGVAPLRVLPPPPVWDASVTRSVAQAFLPAAGRPIVAIHPYVSGYGRDKEWPRERFVELAERLTRTCDAWCYVVRSPKEDAPTAELVRASGGALHDALPRATLVDSMVALQSAALVIGSDSGPLHIAGWLDRPLIGLYGPTDPVVYGPVREHAIVVRGGPEIPPPRQRTRVSEAMLEISVDRVAEAATQVLRGDYPKRPVT